MAAAKEEKEDELSAGAGLCGEVRTIRLCSGLENMRELLGRLGNPQEELAFVHIAGSNGKGSVMNFISTVLTEGGYKTGRYISPTIF